MEIKLHICGIQNSLLLIKISVSNITLSFSGQFYSLVFLGRQTYKRPLSAFALLHHGVIWNGKDLYVQSDTVYLYFCLQAETWEPKTCAGIQITIWWAQQTSILHIKPLHFPPP
jgi:hypothetical protein